MSEYLRSPNRYPVFRTCPECFALVDADHAESHTRWHEATKEQAVKNDIGAECECLACHDLRNVALLRDLTGGSKR